MSAKKKTARTAKTGKVSTKSSSKNTGMAIISYILFFVPLLTDAKRDPFVKFHTKQSIVWLVVMLMVNIIGLLLTGLGIFGWMLSMLLTTGGGLFLCILWIIGILNAANGKQKELPFIGKFAEQLTF